MKPQEKKALGRLIRDRRHGLNWTQERLAGAAGVNLRAVQRVEGGYGIGSENLASLAAALELDESTLRKGATEARQPPADKRIRLRHVRTGGELIEVLQRCLGRGWWLEVGAPDEHRYNKMVGEDILELVEELEGIKTPGEARARCLRRAQAIVSLSFRMGFGLFVGNCTEEFSAKRRRKRLRATLIIAVPPTDPRIVRTTTGAELDVERDSGRLLLGAAPAGLGTTYDRLEDQLICKSDGELRIKDELRGIIGEVMAEVNRAEEQERRDGR